MTVGPGWKVQLPIIFSVIIVSFVAATAFSQWRLSTLDGASRDIADNAAPSIERLAAVRGDMRRLQLLLREYSARAKEDAPLAPAPVPPAAKPGDQSFEHDFH